MLLSGKMLIVGLHCSPEEGMVRAWHIDLGTDIVLPGRHRVSSIRTLSLSFWRLFTVVPLLSWALRHMHFRIAVVQRHACAACDVRMLQNIPFTVQRMVVSGSCTSRGLVSGFWLCSHVTLIVKFPPLQGAVLCLAQAAQFLFSGGQDTTIKVWQFDAASQAFQPLVRLSCLCTQSFARKHVGSCADTTCGVAACAVLLPMLHC